MDYYKILLLIFISSVDIAASKHLYDNVEDITVNILVEEIKELKKDVELLENRVLSLEQEKNATDNSEPLEELRSGRTKRATRRLIPNVAFQATLTKLKEKVKEKQPIKYNKIHTNIGNAYNAATGIFTAPVRGTYSFSTNIVAERGHYIEACIQVGSNVKASAISDHRNKLDIWDQGNAAAILQLHRGAKVFVSVQWPYGEHLIHGVGKTSFSGYLIRAQGYRRY